MVSASQEREAAGVVGDRETGQCLCDGPGYFELRRGRGRDVDGAGERCSSELCTGLGTRGMAGSTDARPTRLLSGAGTVNWPSDVPDLSAGKGQPLLGAAISALQGCP
jgi:hypothetical protein